MTTEPRPPNRALRSGVSPLEVRLYLVAFLAAVHAISWRAIGGQGPETASEIATAPPTREPQRFVWIDNLPPRMRPEITLPAGWQRASAPPAPATTQPARVVRAPSRVRTRSS